MLIRKSKRFAWGKTISIRMISSAFYETFPAETAFELAQRFEFHYTPKYSKICKSEMIRKMLELRGDRVDRWYDAVNKGEVELAELVEFVERDELYTLKVYVEEGNEWIHREFIPGGGTFIYYDDQYQVLPGVGDWAKVNFEVPPEKDGAKRSVFFKKHRVLRISSPQRPAGTNGAHSNHPGYTGENPWICPG